MAYTTWTKVNSYKEFSSSDQRGGVEDCITRAQKMIDTYCARVFEATADTTRKFTVGVDTEGLSLYFDHDCAAITTVTNNADNGSGGVVITAAQYVTLPRNATPYYGIRLLSSTGLAWDYTNDREAGITVAGKWAYSTTAPADIEQACIRLTLYLWELRNSQVFDVTADMETGQMVLPKGLPADVKVMLDPYRRVA